MKSIKKILITRLQWMAVLLMVLLLPLVTVLQAGALRNQAEENAHATFQQIRQILYENTQELETVKEEYRETCLLSAESIAYMIQYHPEILGDIEEFRMIAQMMEVDEIHVFDQTGRIFTGTHPEYYDFTFETGEQIGFFAPLLEDKSLRLCQDITPNTAEGKLVQYSALWSSDGQFIVQVGMYPETVLEYTEKNELSYIFSLLQGSPGVDLYAIDGKTGIILGATSSNDNGKQASQMGLDAETAAGAKGVDMVVDGVRSFCVFMDMDDVILAYVIADDTLYNGMYTYTLLMFVSLLLIVLIVVSLVWQFINHYIVRCIEQINGTINEVADGALNQRVGAQNSLEFSELSDHINNMIHSILASTDKISFVLDHTNMPIGVYEYSTKMKTVRFTEDIPKILGWDEQTKTLLSQNYRLLQHYLLNIQRKPVSGEKNVYQLSGKQEAYVKLEEVIKGTDTLGIIIDVTEDILTRRQIERERDMDLLTGIYNRRGIEQQLGDIFKEEMGYGALIMIDSDSLKQINDAYGHSVGDRYIQKIAEVTSVIGNARHTAGRLGGDEFILLLYGYENEAAVMQDLEQIRYVQKNTDLVLETGEKIPVRFSYGYVLTAGRTDYPRMMAEADEYMYAVKAKRKKTQQNNPL